VIMVLHVRDKSLSSVMILGKRTFDIFGICVNVVT